MIDLARPKGAVFSGDRAFRYALWRAWDTSKPVLMFIGLNPSKAGEIFDDPTVTRMMARAMRADYGGLLVGSLFAYVSTNPRVLLMRPDKVGPETDYFLQWMVRLSALQLCGWGSFEAARRRASAVYDMLTKPVVLGLNKDGQPKHPLYLSYALPMVPWAPHEVTR